MPENSGTLEQIAEGLLAALRPLEEELSAGNIVPFLSSLGLSLPDALTTQGGFMNAVSQTVSRTTQVIGLVDDLAAAIAAGNYGQVARIVVEVSRAFKDIVASFQQIAAQLNSLSAAFPGQVNAIDIQNFAAQLPEKLLGFLLVNHLEGYAPVWLRLLHLAGIVRVEEVPAPAGDFGQSPHVVRSLQLAAIEALLRDPLGHFGNLYGWGRPGFDGVALLKQMYAFAQTFSLPLVADFSRNPPVLSFSFATITPKLDTAGQGLTLALTPDLPAGIEVELPFIFDFTSLRINLSSAFPQATKIHFYPGGKIEVEPPAGDTVQGEAGLTVVRRPSIPNGDILIFGQADGSRFTAKALAAGFGLGAAMKDGKAEGNYRFLLGLEKGEVVITLGGGDGFIASIAPRELRFNADIALSYTGNEGIVFRGSAGLEIRLPLHVSLGAVDIEGLTLALKVANGLALEAGASIKGAFGPLQVVVENVGLRALTTFPGNNSGNLGPVDLAFAFKPPSGVGLSLDAAVVKGGGFLRFAPDKGEYEGMLELGLAGIVTVKAIGLITTRMPDGRPGFSLLLIITAEFGSGLQLGFGFTLLAVGGLLGLNRTMLLDPIAAGIRSGGINSIMFPPNPVANASRIISDLRAYFPPFEGKFLIGPMIRLGWGTPTLVSLSFGLIIEIPGNVAIVGVLRITLPTEQAPVVVINVGFLGALEFDKKRIWFFASLFDSRILMMTLEGDMGLLMDYGDNPNFVLSVGGFHPLFNPPPLPFPNPRRIHIDVLRAALQRITVEGYFAVTSNTVQFGARAELFMGLAVVSIRGHFAFDALFQFSPFKFIIQMSFSVSLDVFGTGVFSIHLQLQLEGPTPWRARGTGSLTIDLWLFELSISADFDITWGDAQNTALEPIDVLPLLADEYNKAENWRAKVPAGNNLLVSVRKLDEQAEKLVLHPLGALQISQRAVPLHLNIDKVGNRKAADGRVFSVKADTAGLGNSGTAPQEKFAVAQYQDMANDEKLTRPAFQDFAGGVELSVAGRQLGATKAVRRVIRYETIILDTNFKRFARKWFSLIGTLFNHFLAGSAVSRSALSHAGKKALVPFPPDQRVQFGQPGYAVANITNNRLYRDTTVFANEATARDYLKSHLDQNPGMAGEIHVIPAFEAALD